MFTSLTLLAAVGALMQNVSLSSAWVHDYAAAREIGARQHKPLAVFIGRGAFDWSQLTREGRPDADVQKLLADRYVRVYIDLSTEHGRNTAQVFGLTGRGLIISDRSGGVQAFRHDGDLPAQDLTRRLERYAEAAVQTTETVAPPAPPPAAVLPNYYGQQFGGVCKT